MMPSPPPRPLGACFSGWGGISSAISRRAAEHVAILVVLGLLSGGLFEYFTLKFALLLRRKLGMISEVRVEGLFRLRFARLIRRGSLREVGLTV